jgi:hypothetical protein
MTTQPTFYEIIKDDEIVKSHQRDGKVKSSPPEADRWTFYEAIKERSGPWAY